MTTTFKVKRYKEYFDIQYVTGLKVPMSVSDNFLASNKQEARKTIEMIRKMEKWILIFLAEKELYFDYRLIVLRYLTAIDSIASGLDIRSKMSTKDLAERFVISYKLDYDEALKEINGTLEYFNQVKNDSTYLRDWRRYDNYNELIRKYMLDYPTIKSDDFKNDELTNMSRLASEALDSLIAYRKNLKNEK